MFEELLSRNEAIQTILYIGDNPGKTKGEIMFRDDRDQLSRARFLRIKDLVDYGLAEIQGDGKETPLTLYLTDKGKEVYESLKDLREIFKTVKRPIYNEI